MYNTGGSQLIFFERSWTFVDVLGDVIGRSRTVSDIYEHTRTPENVRDRLRTYPRPPENVLKIQFCTTGIVSVFFCPSIFVSYIYLYFFT